MAQDVCVIVGAEDSARLAAVVGDRSRPLKHIQRARIVLYSAEHVSVAEVARRAGVSRPAVWRWQLRYAEQGVDGLLRDKTRKPGKAPLPAATVAKVLALTCADPPGETTHWTGRAMAETVGISLRGGAADLASQPAPAPTGCAASSGPPMPPWPRRSRISSACTCTHRPTPWCSRSTRSRRSRRSTAPSRDCRSSPAGPAP